MIEAIFGIAGRMYQIVRPSRNAHYLTFLPPFPCVGCKTTRRKREAMHTGPRGLNQKANDYDALPGCRPCHRELHAIGPMKFQSRRKVDFAELQIMFRSFYRLEFPERLPKKTVEGEAA